jgi:hypothetical protein
MEESLLNQYKNENGSESSLIEQELAGIPEAKIESEETSLLSGSPLDSMNNSLDGNVNNFSSESADEALKKSRAEFELDERKKFFSNPENQADILLMNYVNSSQILVNHNERRRLRREFLKNAKKGAYKKIFNEQIYGINKEESQAHFNKLNG